MQQNATVVTQPTEIRLGDAKLYILTTYLMHSAPKQSVEFIKIFVHSEYKNNFFRLTNNILQLCAKFVRQFYTPIHNQYIYNKHEMK